MFKRIKCLLEVCLFSFYVFSFFACEEAEIIKPETPKIEIPSPVISTDETETTKTKTPEVEKFSIPTIDYLIVPHETLIKQNEYPPAMIPYFISYNNGGTNKMRHTTSTFQFRANPNHTGSIVIGYEWEATISELTKSRAPSTSYNINSNSDNLKVNNLSPNIHYRINITFLASYRGKESIETNFEIEILNGNVILFWGETWNGANDRDTYSMILPFKPFRSNSLYKWNDEY